MPTVCSKVQRGRVLVPPLCIYEGASINQDPAAKRVPVEGREVKWGVVLSRVVVDLGTRFYQHFEDLRPALFCCVVDRGLACQQRLRVRVLNLASRSLGILGL
jgi:hypothetical protein